MPVNVTCCDWICGVRCVLNATRQAGTRPRRFLTYIALSASHFTKACHCRSGRRRFPREDRELLRGKGVDLEGLETVPGKTFFWSGVYPEDMNDRKT